MIKANPDSEMMRVDPKFKRMLAFKKDELERAGFKISQRELTERLAKCFLDSLEKEFKNKKGER